VMAIPLLEAASVFLNGRCCLAMNKLFIALIKI
jgi:hypothetical protein